MTKKMCLDCGAISSQTRCPIHRTKQARGYGAQHENSRKQAMAAAPYCWKCFCPASKCRLEWHHVTELQGGRNPDSDDRRQLLCVKCHNSIKEK